MEEPCITLQLMTMVKSSVKFKNIVMNNVDQKDKTADHHHYLLILWWTVIGILQ